MHLWKRVGEKEGGDWAQKSRQERQQNVGGCGEGETCNFRVRKICEKGWDGAGKVALQIPFGQLLKTCLQTRIKKGFLASLNESRKNKDNSGEKKNPGEITPRFDR